MEPVLQTMEAPLQLSDFLDRICAIITIKLLSNLFVTDLFNLLRRLELGVFYFCWRKYDQAVCEDQPFSYSLELQAKAEYRHAQTFSALCGRFIPEPIAQAFERPMSWGTLDFDNEVFNVDGISRKYLTAKVFFGNKKAKDLDWENCLAMMAVLESFQFYFYGELINNISNNYSKILDRISIDEILHKITLEHELMFSYPRRWRWLLIKWHIRKYLALFALPIDIRRYRHELRR